MKEVWVGNRLAVIPLGKVDIKRSGKEVTLVATGAMVHRALEAAQILEEIGLGFEVIRPHTLEPLDEATLLASVAKTWRPVIVHEARVTGGYEAEVAAVFTDKAFSELKAPMKRMGPVETPAPLSRVLEREYLPFKDSRRCQSGHEMGRDPMSQRGAGDNWFHQEPTMGSHSAVL